MKEIDWSKASEDATHYQPAYEVFDNPVFWRIVNGVAREVWTVSSLDEDINYHFTYGPEGNDCYIPERCIERPKQVWNGEGNPPAGTICEIKFSQWWEGWEEAEVLCIGKKMVFVRQVTRDGQTFEGSINLDGIEFRPIKTQEQVAAEEREKAIHEMWMQVTTDCGDTIGIQKRACADLYDAGYRLTKTEE